MTKADAILDAAMQLDHDLRANLALRLLESLDGPPDAGWEAAWAEELERRVEGIRDGSARLVPAAEVHRRLRERIAGSRD